MKKSGYAAHGQKMNGEAKRNAKLEKLERKRPLKKKAVFCEEPTPYQINGNGSYGVLKQLKKLGAWQVHALWLLFRNISADMASDLRNAAKSFFVTATREQVEELLECGCLLGLVKKSSSSFIRTPASQDFALLPHWRMWRPQANVQNALLALGRGNWFLPPQKFESRRKVIDLFSGAGGLGLGFEKAGFKVVSAVDNDPQAAAAHKLNFPDCAVLNEDITKIAKDPKRYLCAEIGVEDQEISGVIGGPPCQGFSYIGERQVTDERNLLTSRFVDVVLGIEPDFFLLENVTGLLNSGSKPTLENYLRQQCKSIGAPASQIVDALPSVPKVVAKRDRQFRKKLISRVVTDFGKHVRAELSGLTGLDDVVVLAGALIENLTERLCDAAQSAYGKDHFDACQGSIQKSALHIGIIALTTLVTEALEKKPYSKFTPEILLDAILPKIKAPIRQRLEQMLAEHHQAPDDVVYKGVKVGPVLYHLIQRASLKYEITAPRILSAAKFGTPQDRRRLFVVGLHRRLRKEFSFPEPSSYIPKGIPSPDLLLQPAPTSGEAIGDLPDVDRYKELIESDILPVSELACPVNDFAKQMRVEVISEFDWSLPRPAWNPFAVDCSKRTLHEPKVLERLSKLPEGIFDEASHKTRLHRGRVSHTIRAGTRENKGSHTAVRPVHYQYNRVITVREGARLMGFPDWMTFHQTKWHGFRLVGNGVPAPLAFSLANQIRRQLGEQH